MKVLVTGGCGFFGAWILKQLLDEGHSVVVVDVVLFTKRWDYIMKDAASRVTFIAGKVDEPSFVAAVVEQRPDAIIHLAGLQVPTCRDNPVLGASVNVIGTLNVFEAAKQIAAAGGTAPRIVYASSAAIFGPDAEYGEAPVVGDSSAPKPTSHYGAYKLCIEHCAQAYFTTNGINSVGLRPLTVYGPGRDQGLTSFPSRSIAAALLEQRFDIPFTGATTYIHAREISDIFVKCAQVPVAGAKVYTIGGDTVDTASFIAELEKAVPGAAALITCSGGSLPIASKLDDATLRRDFPSLLRIPLAQGIAETVAVFRELKSEGRLVA